MKRILLLWLCCILLLSMVACQTPTDIFDPEDPSDTSGDLDLTTCYTEALTPVQEPTCYVQFTLTCGATFVIELYPDQAPLTVAHFQQLVADHYYDGLTFYRVWKNFCVYGGGVNTTDPDYVVEPLEGEFSSNGFEGNTLQHTRGTISMWHASDAPDSATTQFFIMQKDSVACDGKYAAFGRVVLGMETIDAIANIALTEEQPSNTKTKPVKPPVIESVTFVQSEDVELPQ